MEVTDQQKRHWLMRFWRSEMARQMSSEEYADFEDPVGLILALDDKFARPIAEAIGQRNGVTVEDIERICAECKISGDYPTLRLVTTAAHARELMQFTATTAQANFDNLNTQRVPGDYFLIVIGYDGNSYGFVSIPERATRPAQDGQNRTRRQ